MSEMNTNYNFANEKFTIIPDVFYCRYYNN